MDNDNKVIKQPLDYVKIETKKPPTNVWLFVSKYIIIGLCIGLVVCSLMMTI